LDEATGRPIKTPQPPGAPVYPSSPGGTSWYSPSYSPRTGLFYISTWEDVAIVFQRIPVRYKEGQSFIGAVPAPGTILPDIPGPINTYTEAAGHGGVIALDPHTGDKKWSFEMHDVNTSGILTTASDLLFVGGREGYFHVLNAKSGVLLWKVNLGGPMIAAPITYQVDGKQYVAIASGNSLFAFALRNQPK
jgi:outer membrane protein assembly factor BamB